MGFQTTTTCDTLHILLGSVRTNATMTNGSPTLSSSGFGFTAADVGRYCMVFEAGPGGAPIITTIASYSSGGAVDLVTSASSSVSDVTVIVFRPRGALTETPRYNNVLNWTGRDTASFTVISKSTDADWPFEPIVGMPVLFIDDDDGDLFGGTIDQTRSMNPYGLDVLVTECTCISYDQLASKRTTGQPDSGSTASPVNGTFTNTAAGDIFEYLVEHALGGDGMGSIVETGPVISEISFAYTPCDVAFSALASQSSNDADTYFWRIDPWRVAHFELQSTTVAPWNISDLDASDGNVLMQISVTKTREKYVNRSIINLGSYTLPAALETYPGDGTAVQFGVTSPIAAEPTITISIGGGPDTPQSVGILNDPTTGTGKDWYWTLGSNIVTQDAGGTVLTGADNISITFQGSSQAFFQYQNSTAVDERSGVEGGTGYYELVTEVTNPTGASDALTLAQSIALSYGRIPDQVQIQTFRGGLKAGQLIPIHLDGRVDSTFLIDAVTMTVQGNRKFWTANAVDGALIGDWRTTLKNLSSGGGNVVGGVSSGSGGISTVTDTVTSISADATLGTRPEIVEVDSTAGDVTVTLPSATTMIGLRKSVKKTVAAHNVVIDAAGSETIDGALTVTMTDQWQGVTIESVSASEWVVVSSAVSVTPPAPTAPGDFTIGVVTAVRSAPLNA